MADRPLRRANLTGVVCDPPIDLMKKRRDVFRGKCWQEIEAFHQQDSIHAAQDRPPAAEIMHDASHQRAADRAEQEIGGKTLDAGEQDTTPVYMPR